LRRIGSFANFVPAAEDASINANAGLWNRITSEMLQRGVTLLPTGKSFLSTAHTCEDVDRTVAALSRVVDQLSLESAVAR
jgi:glutamate-1-semialdehyde 2,1-aminomutase